MRTYGLFSALARARAGYNKGQAAGDQAREAHDLAEASQLAQMYAQQRAAANERAQLGLQRDRLGFDREKMGAETKRAEQEFTARMAETRAAREATAAERAADRASRESIASEGRQATLTAAGMRIAAQQQPRPARMTGAIVQNIAENRANLAKIDQAIEAVTRNPGAFGLKNYLGDAIMQRADPNGVDPRAMVADIGSLVFHERSGAAVTPSEAQRLKPFIPSATDSPEKVVKTLKLLRQRAASIAEELEAHYGQTPGSTPGAPPNAPPANAPATRTAPAAGSGPIDLSRFGLEPPPVRRARP